MDAGIEGKGGLDAVKKGEADKAEDPLPGPVEALAAQMVVHGLPRWPVGRHQAPGTADPQYIQQGIHPRARRRDR